MSKKKSLGVPAKKRSRVAGVPSRRAATASRPSTRSRATAQGPTVAGLVEVYLTAGAKGYTLEYGKEIPVKEYRSSKRVRSQCKLLRTALRKYLASFTKP